MARKRRSNWRQAIRTGTAVRKARGGKKQPTNLIRRSAKRG